jgi:hypothetical protein
MTWSTYRYLKFFSGEEGVVSRPMIEVELAHGKHKLFPVIALIDSGCSTSMINASYAKDLGIDVPSGVHLPVGGIGNGQSDGYVHMLCMNVKDSDYTFEAPFNFVTDLPIDILLGQNTFFDHFDVLFEKHLGFFKLQKSQK